MKKIILVALFSLGVKAYGQPPLPIGPLINAQAVKVVVPYGVSCSSLTLSSTTIEITGNSSTLVKTGLGIFGNQTALSNGFYDLKIWDLSLTTAAYVSSDSGVTGPSGTHVGAPIGPQPSSGQNLPVEFVINPMQQFFAVSGSSIGIPNSPVIEICAEK